MSFPFVLEQVCVDLTQRLGASGGVLFLHDEAAPGFAVGATCGSASPDLKGRVTEGQDAELLRGILAGDSAPPARMPDDQWRCLGHAFSRLLPLRGPLEVGVIAMTGGHPALPQHLLDDITREGAARIAEAATDASHRCAFRRVLEMQSDGIAIVEGPRHTFSYANAALRRMIRRQGTPVLGRTLAEVLPDLPAAAGADLLDQVRETGAAHHQSVIEARDEFGIEYFELHLLPHPTAGGEERAISLVLRPRTDETVTRHALQSTIVRLGESQSVFAAVLDASNNGILFINSERVAVYANHCIHVLFGLNLDDLVGHPVEQVVAEMQSRASDPEAYTARLLALYEAFEETVVDDVELVRPAHRILERYSAPVYKEDGSLHGRIEAYRDVTAERMLLRNKDEFLSLLSHELRTPVTSIKGYAQLLERRARHEELPQHTITAYEVIQRQVSRLQELIDALLDLSRLETGRLALQRRPLDLGELVERAVTLARMTADEPLITVALPEESVWIVGDERRLEQVVTNLLSNAIRHTPEHGSVEVRLEHDPGVARLLVRDTGKGIPAEALPHIFERFYRPEGAGGASAGMGIGLYVSKGIVEEHGGSIIVESQPGFGTTFTVTVPLGEE